MRSRTSFTPQWATCSTTAFTIGSGFSDGVTVDPNHATLMVELEQTGLGEDSSLDVLVNEPGSDFKAFGEKLDGACLVSETDKGDFAITPRDSVLMKNKGFWNQLS